MQTMIDATAEALAKQFTEPTGRHMLDSGGAYGRKWEANQGMTAADFLAAPDVVVDDYGCVTTNAFTILSKHLEHTRRAASLTEQFRAYVASTPEGEGYYNSLDTVEEWLETLEATGPEGRGEPYADNTYNWETLIGDVFLYVEFELAGTRYLALSYHGGCDVRGGYTDFVIYRACGCWAYALTEAYLHCENRDCEWSGADIRGGELVDADAGDIADYDLKDGCPMCHGKLSGSLGECYEW